MQGYKPITIPKAQSAMACLLLVCQLLTSCTSHAIFLPVEPASPLTTPVHEAQRPYPDDRHAYLAVPSNAFLDATPLKMGQPEIQFTWDQDRGLQAFRIDTSKGPMATPSPLQLPTTINPGNGSKRIVLKQLNEEQATAVVTHFKWEVSQGGELKERGIRVRGGGRGRSKGSANKGQFKQKTDASSGSQEQIPQGAGSWGEQQEWWKGSYTGGRQYEGRSPGKGRGTGSIQTSQSAKIPSKDRKGKSKGSASFSPQAQTSEQPPTSQGSGSSQGKGTSPATQAQGSGDTQGAASSSKPAGKSKRSSVSSRSSRSSIHTDCSNDSKQEIYHNIINGLVKDFFRDHFKTSPYLPNLSLQSAENLAGIHNQRKTEINKHCQDKKIEPTHLVDAVTYEPRGINVVIASITFFDAENTELAKTYIKAGRARFVAPYGDMDINNKALRKELHTKLIDEFNQSLSSFLTNHPNILKTKVKIKEDDGKDTGKEIDNPLLREGGYSGKPVYDTLQENIDKALDAAVKNTEKYPNFERIEDKDEEDRIILKSIISARRHSEEALAEYMRKDEFHRQLDELLEKEKDKVDKIRIDVHSTKESCLPCQITLRAVRQALAEKFFGADLAAALHASSEEELARKEAERLSLQISSQEAYKHTSKDGTSPTVQEQTEDTYNYPIQYNHDTNFSSVELSDDKQGMEGKATAFIDGVFGHKHGLDGSLNGSAAQKQVERLETINEEQAIKLQAAEKAQKAAEAKAEAEAKAREAAEAEARKAQAKIEELQKLLAAQQATTASSSKG